MNRSGTVVLFISLLAAGILTPMATANSASGPDFTAASSSITSAFLAVSHAQQEGGNVTGLVASLNAALGLYAEAQKSNSTDPAAAASYLQNATLVAQQVSQQAPAVGQAGSAARQLQEYLSVGSAMVIVAVAAALYIYGERIYLRLWYWVYSRYTVRKVG